MMSQFVWQTFLVRDIFQQNHLFSLFSSQLSSTFPHSLFSCLLVLSCLLLSFIFSCLLMFFIFSLSCLVFSLLVFSLSLLSCLLSLSLPLSSFSVCLCVILCCVVRGSACAVCGVVCVVWCWWSWCVFGVRVWCAVCGAAREKTVGKPVSGFRHASVCTFKTSPCVHSKRPRSTNTCGRGDGTRGEGE